jgi:hypothetical protein
MTDPTVILVSPTEGHQQHTPACDKYRALAEAFGTIYTEQEGVSLGSVITGFARYSLHPENLIQLAVYERGDKATVDLLVHANIEVATDIAQRHPEHVVQAMLGQKGGTGFTVTKS